MARQRGCVDPVKREAVLDAALELLAAPGRHTSLAQIAVRAGVSKQTLYNHYHDKSEVIAALLAGRCAALQPPLIALSGDKTEDALAHYGEALLEYVSKPLYMSLSRALIIGVWTEGEFDQIEHALSLSAAIESLSAFFLAEPWAIRAADGDLTSAAVLYVELLTAAPILAAMSRINGDSPPAAGPADRAKRARACARLFLASQDLAKPICPKHMDVARGQMTS